MGSSLLLQNDFPFVILNLFQDLYQIRHGFRIVVRNDVFILLVILRKFTTEESTLYMAWILGPSPRMTFLLSSSC